MGKEYVKKVDVEHGEVSSVTFEWKDPEKEAEKMVVFDVVEHANQFERVLEIAGYKKRSVYGDLHITSIDLKLLEEQRLVLASIPRGAHLNPQQFDAIVGVSGMLEDWADKRDGVTLTS